MFATKINTKGTLEDNFSLSFVAASTGLIKLNSSCPIYRVGNFTCAPDQAHKNGLAKPKSTSE